MRPGVVVGEVSLYLGTGSTAEVAADVPSVVLRLRRTELERLQREDPEVAARIHRWFATMLAERLAETIRALDASDD
jgi:SulP family sulfate permease